MASESCNIDEEPKVDNHSDTAYYWSDSSNSQVASKSDLGQEIAGRKKKTENKTGFLIEVENVEP